MRYRRCSCEATVLEQFNVCSACGVDVSALPLEPVLTGGLDSTPASESAQVDRSAPADDEPARISSLGPVRLARALLFMLVAALIAAGFIQLLLAYAATAALSGTLGFSAAEANQMWSANQALQRLQAVLAILAVLACLDALRAVRQDVLDTTSSKGVPTLVALWGAWFVPIVHIFVPALAIARLQGAARGVARACWSRQLAFWLAGWIVIQLGYGAAGVLADADSADQLANILMLYAVLEILTAGVVALFAAVLKALTDDLSGRHRLRSGLAPVWVASPAEAR